MRITRRAMARSLAIGRQVWIEASPDGRLALHLAHRPGWRLLAIVAGASAWVITRRG